MSGREEPGGLPERKADKIGRQEMTWSDNTIGS